jgi:hypothetical protein
MIGEDLTKAGKSKNWSAQHSVELAETREVDRGDIWNGKLKICSRLA